jgi:hypothetical protein
MPSRKQRRRREKLKRHEYEEVYIDATTGEEVDVDPDEVDQLAPKRQPKAAATTKQAQPMRGRGGRVIQPPSWQRVIRRGAIFGPFMFITVYLLAPKHNRPIAGLLLQTLVLLGFFIPFSYFMDRFTYNASLRRAGKSTTPKK